MTTIGPDVLLAAAFLPIIIGIVQRSLTGALAGTLFAAVAVLAALYVTTLVGGLIWLAGCALAILAGQLDRGARASERRHRELIEALAELRPASTRAPVLAAAGAAPSAYVAGPLKPAEPPPAATARPRLFG